MNAAEFNEIKTIIETIPADEWTRHIEESRSYNQIFHLSDLRENAVGFIPVTKEDIVLELNCGCGAVTGNLLRRAKKVTAVDGDREYCELAKLRHKTAENLTVVNKTPAEFLQETGETYTCIFMLDTLQRTEHMEEAKRLLALAAEKLRKGGLLVVAVPNRYGMRYFAGGAYPGTDKYYSGIDGNFKNVPHTCFSRTELTGLMKAADFKDLELYYPYPDHHFPLSVFSDERLPGSGELVTNQLSFNWERFSIFDENMAFEGIREEGAFPVFSNSYLITGRR